MAGVYGRTEAAAWFGESFAPAVMSFFNEQKDILTTVMNANPFWEPGSNTIVVPKIGSRTAESAPMSDYANATEAAGTITIDQESMDAWAIKKIADMMSKPEMAAAFAKAGGIALANAVRTYVAVSMIQAATTKTVTLGVANTLTFAKLLEAQRILNIINLKIRNCALGLSPEAFELSVASWDTKYTSAADTGDESFFKSGAEGRVLGMPVFVSDDWDGDAGSGDETASIWHPSAVAYADPGGVLTTGPVPIPLSRSQGMSISINYGAVKLIDAGIVNFNNP